jgi:hypothetical protein
MSLGTLFAPGTARKVGDRRAALDATLQGGSPLYTAGDLGLSTPGSQGNDYLQQAAALGAHHIGVNTTAMDADQAKVGALGSLYSNLFQHGGLAEQAATQMGNADIANSAQGGAAGIQNQIANSRQIMGRTSDVGTQERAQNAEGANQMDVATAAGNLARATMQAQVSHANHMSALQAQAVSNYLGNQQISNDQSVASAVSGARANEANTNQQVSNAQWQSGIQVGTGILGAGAAAGSTLASMGSNEAQANNLLNQQYTQAEGLALTAPTTSLKLAQTPNPFDMGHLSLAYPSSANAWAIPSTTTLP